MFVGPGKQRISKRSLGWTMKRKDTANNSLDANQTGPIWQDCGIGEELRNKDEPI